VIWIQAKDSLVDKICVQQTEVREASRSWIGGNVFFGAMESVFGGDSKTMFAVAELVAELVAESDELPDGVRINPQL